MRYNSDSFNAGETLKKVREDLFMTREQFADRLGISKRKLEDLEDRNTKQNGEPRSVGINTYLEMCDHYGCDIDFLLGVQKHPYKEDADVSALTGLDAHSIDVLKKEVMQPPVADVRSKKVKSKPAVIIGIKTADIFNGLLGMNGVELTQCIHQYVRERMVTSLLDESVENIVQHHNKEHDRSDSSQSVVAYANSVLTNLRMITSLSSMTMTGRVQKGIEDDFTNFCKKMTAEGYNKTECRIIFDYLQSRGRAEALRMNCYDLMMKFLDGMAETGHLKYHSGMGDFDVTATMLYEDSVDSIEETKKELLVSALKKEMASLKSNVRDLMEVNKKLLDDNKILSAELSETRWYAETLKKDLDRIRDDTEAIE